MTNLPEGIKRLLDAEAARREPVPIETVMFGTAVGFHEAAQRSFEQRAHADGTVSFPVVPAIVSLAFACELYLKALHALSTGKGRQGHRLNVLFAGLAQDHIEKIEGRFCERTGKSPADLRADLAAFGNAFVEWRYVYEQKSAQIDVQALGQLAATLYEVGTELRPEWVQRPYLDPRLRAPTQGVPWTPHEPDQPSRPFVP